MVALNGTYFMTIPASEDEVYHITGVTQRRADVLNSTEDVIYISSENDFDADSETGVYPCIIVPGGVAVNDVPVPKTGIYIKTAADSGNVTVMGCA